MMSIKIDWEKLRKIHQSLLEQPTLDDNSNIIFVIITQDGKARKSIVKLKDFINFLWTLSDNPRYNVLALVVQDEEGRILYRHKTLTAGNEEIPVGGSSVISHWSTLTQKEKDTYILLLEAQINSYDV